MKIIDRYLLWQFARTFGICYFSMLGLFVVFDLFSNIEEFFRHGEQCGFLPLVAWFYGFRTLLFFDFSSGVLTLVASIVTVAVLQRHNELIALMAAGVSKLRIVAPIIGATVAITVLAVASRELLIPHFRDELSMTPQDFDATDGKDLRHAPRDQRTYIQISGEKSFLNEKKITKPSVILPPALSQYGRHLQAETAYYRPEEGDRPPGYLLRDVTRPTEVAQKESLNLDGRPVVFMPKDTDWLAPNECFVVSGVTFEQLAGGDAWRTYSSTFSLVQGLHNPSLDFGTNVRLEVHRRIVQPLLDITLLFLGLPLVLRRSSRNVFIALGACGIIVIAFLVVQISSHSLGLLYATPVLGAWFPLIVFLPIAVAMYEAFQT